MVEVADSNLQYDRVDRARMYADASIIEYWIVNLIDRQLEVYTQPAGPGAAAGYASVQVHGLGTSVPLILDGVTLGQIAVDDLLAPGAVITTERERDGRRIDVPAFRMGRDDIWGATAMVLAEFLVVLGWNGPPRGPLTP